MKIYQIVIKNGLFLYIYNWCTNSSDAMKCSDSMPRKRTDKKERWKKVGGTDRQYQSFCFAPVGISR